MTYSIVARDESTGALGVAVQSHFFNAGRLVCWAEAGVGAVATQAIPEVAYGPDGLDLLRSGTSAPDALQRLLAEDEGREVRQVAMVDAQGGVAVHSGAACVEHAGHETRAGASAQSNMAGSARVWGAMLDAYEADDGDFAARLLAALRGGEEAGGDARGRQSAALLIVGPTRSDRPWEGELMNLRVEDHADPIGELTRLVGLNRSFGLMMQTLLGGPLLVGGPLDESHAPIVDDAVSALDQAQVGYGDNLEPTFWKAVILAKAGRVDDARVALGSASSGHAGWRDFIGKLPAAGFVDADRVRAVLDQ